MNEKTKERIAAWTAALRSGEYKQGRQSLRVNAYDGSEFTGEYRYCCLGVLCDLYVKDGNELPLPIDYDEDEGNDWWAEEYPPTIVYGWLGWDLTQGMQELDLVPRYTNAWGNILLQSDLAFLNDNDQSFDVIADYIDELAEKLL